MLHVVLAPSLSPLVDRLAKRLAAPISSVFSAEHLVVPARAMGEWLGVELSDRLGVWSGHAAYAPSQMLERWSGKAVGAVGAWQVLAALEGLRDRPGFEAPGRYLDGDETGLRGVQLSQRIAALYGRYARYRPDLLREWSQGGGEGWQAELWREVQGEGGGPVAALDGFLEGLDAAVLPERISIFCVDHLAPLELDLVRGVGAHTDLWVFARSGTPLAEALQDEVAETLEVDRPDSALAMIQAGRSPARVDETFRVHACHGRQREVEVLRDVLLARFAADDTLQPEDVLVLAPDINDYAALVEGVFGTELDVSKRPGARARIPVCFADRAPLAEAPGLAAFRGVLSLAFSRRPLSKVAALLDSPPVQATFAISEDDAGQLCDWLELAKVRWGEDASFRTRFHNPALPSHTWRWGLDRLLLGYAIEGDGERLYEGMLPVKGIEGPGAQPLGALCAFCEVLFAQLSVLEQPRPVSDWPVVLLAAYDALVSSGSLWARSRAQLVSALGELEGDLTVGLAAVMTWLDTKLELLDRHERFFAGGVTFASLRPGRAIPARVVCLLGLDHDRYPRDPARLAFDLLAADPQPGDLGSRDEDRLSFEAAVHAAGDHLHLSFVGRGNRDNKDRPPSVLVADLLDLVGPARVGEVKVAHSMQPFSPRIFRDPDWPAYSKAWRAGALALEGGGGVPTPFFSKPLPEADEAKVVPLSLLLRFFQNPAKALLSVRLDLRFPWDETGVPDREPFALNFLEQWQVGQPLVEALLGGTDPQTLCPVMSASGLLPMGTPGRLVFSEILDKAQKVADEALTCGAGEAVGDVDVDLDIGGRRLLGRLDGRHEKGALYVAYGSKSPKRFLSGWIKHLVAHEAGVNPLQLWVVGRGSQNKSGVESWGPVPEAGACLGVLLDLYGQGMLEPLPFMPKTSHTYASAYAAARFDKGLEEQEAREVGQSKAAGAWFSTQLRGGDSIPGEGEDPAVARTFEASVIKSEEFHRTALCVFLPLLGHSLPEDLLS